MLGGSASNAATGVNFEVVYEDSGRRRYRGDQIMQIYKERGRLFDRIAKFLLRSIF